MVDLSSEIEEIRLDIDTLRAMIDVAVANGVGADDPILRACANTLYERHSRLEVLLRDSPPSSDGRRAKRRRN